MPRRQLASVRPQEKTQREVEDLRLVLKARNGDDVALDTLVRRYTGFVRLKASSYFIAGGESDDLIQEGLIGLYKAVRDFRSDKDTSFRSFAAKRSTWAAFHKTTRRFTKRCRKAIPSECFRSKAVRR